MDIKELLENQIQKAERMLLEIREGQQLREQEALTLFAPIATAMEQLQTELASRPGFTFTISPQAISIRTPDGRQINCRYPFGVKLQVRSDFHDLGPIEFTKPEDVIEHIVGLCALSIADAQGG